MYSRSVAPEPSTSAGIVIGTGLTIMCRAKPPRYWNAPEGAVEWGRRNNVPPGEAKKKFHEIKEDDPDPVATMIILSIQKRAMFSDRRATVQAVSEIDANVSR